MQTTKAMLLALGLIIITGGSLTAQRSRRASAMARDTAGSWAWHGRVAAGKDLSVRGISGNILAVPARGAEVVAHARKYRGDGDDRSWRRRSRGDTADVQIHVEQNADGVTICAVYPGDDIAGASECPAGSRESRRRYHSSDDDQAENVCVDFVVEVPAGVNFVGLTTNGSVEADSMPGNAEVHTTNGDAIVSARGHGSATTTNGSVRADLGRTDWTERAEFTTTNGSVTVTLPPDLNADISARTTNGEIETDFPMLVEGRLGRNRMHGKVGTGGKEILLETTNGSIEIRKR